MTETTSLGPHRSRFKSLKARVPFFVVAPLLVGIGISWWVSHFHISRSWGVMEEEATRLFSVGVVRSIEDQTDVLRHAVGPASQTSQADDWTRLLEDNPRIQSLAVYLGDNIVRGAERTVSGVKAFSGTLGQTTCQVWTPSTPPGANEDARLAVEASETGQERIEAAAAPLGALASTCSLRGPSPVRDRGYLGTRFEVPQFFIDVPVSRAGANDGKPSTITVGMRQEDLQNSLNDLVASTTLGGVAVDGDDQVIAIIEPSDRTLGLGFEALRPHLIDLLATAARTETGTTFLTLLSDTPAKVAVTSPPRRNGQTGGRVLVFSPEGSMFSLDHPATRQTLFLAIAALLLSAWLGLRIARSITGPAATLAGYAESLQTGTHKPELIGKLRHRADEFGSLANSFLNMTEILLARQEDLKSLVEQRTTDLRAQSESLALKNEETERLLLNILPPSIMRRLQTGEVRLVDESPDVTIIFCDLVGFTRLSEELPAEQLVDILNTLFSEFDRLTLVHGVEKIKTIGDAYMAVSGLPEARPDHARAAMEFALAMQEVLGALNRSLNSELSIRIGMNSGPVTAGIIGTHKFAYDIWGAAVNIASRMESSGIPGRIQISGATHEMVSKYYVFEDRGEIDIKGKGPMKTYLYAERIDAPPLRGEGSEAPEGSEEETSWGSLLTSEVSLKSIRSLLTKDLFSKGGVKTPGVTPKANPEREEGSWAELLTSPISLGGLRSLLTKEIGLPVKKD